MFPPRRHLKIVKRIGAVLMAGSVILLVLVYLKVKQYFVGKFYELVTDTS